MHKNPERGTWRHSEFVFKTEDSNLWLELFDDVEIEACVCGIRRCVFQAVIAIQLMHRREVDGA